MSDDNDFTKRLNDAEAMFDGFRQLSESLNGAVNTLIGEGWSEQQAREIVVASFLRATR